MTKDILSPSEAIVVNITNKLLKQNDLTLLTDQGRPITTDLCHLSLIQPLTSRQNWPISLYKLGLEHSTDNKYSLDSDDDFRSDCRNVSHHNRWKSFSCLNSLARSNYTITCFPRVQTIYYFISKANNYVVSVLYILIKHTRISQSESL